MRPDASFTPPKRNRPMTAAEACADEMLVIIAGDMFAAGFSTADIASRFIIPEAAAFAALQVARARQQAGGAA